MHHYLEICYIRHQIQWQIQNTFRAVMEAENHGCFDRCEIRKNDLKNVVWKICLETDSSEKNDPSWIFGLRILRRFNPAPNCSLMDCPLLCRDNGKWDSDVSNRRRAVRAGNSGPSAVGSEGTKIQLSHSHGPRSLGPVPFPSQGWRPDPALSESRLRHAYAENLLGGRKINWTSSHRGSDRHSDCYPAREPGRTGKAQAAARPARTGCPGAARRRPQQRDITTSHESRCSRCFT